jgi:hypothetical protein
MRGRGRPGRQAVGRRKPSAREGAESKNSDQKTGQVDQRLRPFIDKLADLVVADLLKAYGEKP